MNNYVGKYLNTFLKIMNRGTSKEVVEKLALEIENVKKHMEGKTLAKVIVVPEKIVNIVVK